MNGGNAFAHSMNSSHFILAQQLLSVADFVISRDQCWCSDILA